MELLESDGVPGATLNINEIEGYLVHQLKRWLACRNLRQSGNKNDLVTSAGQAHILWPGIDRGKWAEQKQQALLGASGEEVVEEPILPIGGWRPFPGYRVPQHFNEGHIFYYLVESMPQLQTIAGKRIVLGDGVDSDGEEHFHPGSDKLLKRARRLVDSGYVENVHDNLQDTKYFLKAYVRASMALR